MFRNFFSKPAIAEITPQEARAKQQAGAVIVDVRETYEFREGYIFWCSSYSTEESFSADERARSLERIRRRLPEWKSQHDCRAVLAAGRFHTSKQYGWWHDRLDETEVSSETLKQFYNRRHI